jgi:hypothetical protein
MADETAQSVSPMIEPAVVEWVAPEASVHNRFTFICAQLPFVRRATNRKVGVVMPTQIGGETAEPFALIDKDCESLLEFRKKDSLPAVTELRVSDQPAAPLSNEPLGASE